MEIKDFIGKEVMSASTKEYFIIYKLDGVGIYVRTIKPNGNGT